MTAIFACLVGSVFPMAKGAAKSKAAAKAAMMKRPAASGTGRKSKIAVNLKKAVELGQALAKARKPTFTEEVLYIECLRECLV